jgi:hypothetical protein
MAMEHAKVKNFFPCTTMMWDGLPRTVFFENVSHPATIQGGQRVLNDLQGPGFLADM